MKLSPPFCISARLLPTLQIGDSWLSCDPSTRLFYLDTPDGKNVITDFHPAASSGLQEWFKAILSFMDAAADAQRSLDQGRFTDNGDLFEPLVMRWCQENADEIGQLRFELEEVKGLIT